MTKPELRKTIKQDLLDQIQRNGTCGSYYTDLVDNYMTFWDITNDLIADIKARGTVVLYTSNTGQKNMKKNESVDGLLKVNTQMTNLLDKLGISPSQAGADDDTEM